MSNLNFDPHQFYKPPAQLSVQSMLGYRGGEKSKGISISRQTGLDFDDLGGMRVITPRVRTHKDSAWSKDSKQVMALLDTVFPALRRSKHPERLPSFLKAARWIEVIRHYFDYGESARSVALRLSCSVGAVKVLIAGIRRVRCGLTVNGSVRSKRRNLSFKKVS